MEFSLSHHFLSNSLFLVLFFLLCSTVFPMRHFTDFWQDNQTFPADNELKMKLIKDHLKKINKPFVKSIKSPDGDIIDCVLIHLQPAFDHPKLKGTTIPDPPQIPSRKNEGLKSEINQLWSSKGDSCPNGTIPIRRTSENDILRWDSISKFGLKYSIKDSTPVHEYAVARIEEKQYGIRATLNAWGPRVTNERDFSLAQVWLVNNENPFDINTVESGWQVFPQLYNDDLPRLFTYWTNNGYRPGSGCYNLMCPGFVQTNNQVALGSALRPLSTYNGDQYVLQLSIWKDPRTKDWWLEIGTAGLVGYWPSALFPHLNDHATVAEVRGEVLDSQRPGPHTSTQMGSGHFPFERFKKAAFVKNIEVFGGNNEFIPPPNIIIYADRPACYFAINGFDDSWGNYIYYGGPGKNPICM